MSSATTNRTQQHWKTGRPIYHFNIQYSYTNSALDLQLTNLLHSKTEPICIAIHIIDICMNNTCFVKKHANGM